MHTTTTNPYTDKIESHDEDLIRKLRELAWAADLYIEAIESGMHIPGGYDLARLGHDVEAGVEVRKALYEAQAIINRLEEGK